MADASDVADDSPLVRDRVVETRSGQGSPQVGIAIPPEYSLHEKALGGAKLLSQCRKISVGRRLRHCQHTKLYAGTWNVRSLVEESGDRRVCRARSTSLYGKTVERKVDLLVSELKNYNISIAGIQETKWFGSDIWPIGEWTFLHSGHELPVDSDNIVRRNGVGILLNGRATAAWRAAGGLWKAVSPRIVWARLKLASAGQRLAGGLRRSRDVFMSVVCVYAPTVRAPGDMTRCFYDDLQDVLSGIPPSDLLLMSGDLNAHVGVRDRSSELWSDVLGCFGIKDRNQAGEDLLNFCDLNQLSLMNTWFQKDSFRYGTWTHPATRSCSMIDFVVVRAAQRQYCLDVQVMRGATCWTDHKLVRVKLRLYLGRSRRQRDGGAPPIAVWKLADPSTREDYGKELSDRLEGVSFDDVCSAEAGWEQLRDCLVASAIKVVGCGHRRQPDWFLESEQQLSPLLAAKRQAWNQVLCDDSPSSRQRFRQSERIVKHAVQDAKEAWIKKTAEAANVDRDGRGRWSCVKQLQEVFHGRRSVRTSGVLSEDGQLLSEPVEVVARWFRHFGGVLDVPSQFSQECVDRMTSCEERTELDDPPTEEEFENALGKVKLRKASGTSRISPEMLVSGGPVLHRVLLGLFRRVWREGCVFGEWRDALVVPVPKRGDLNVCDNWRGISLLDVAGKLLGRILQERLQLIAENVLPDSQCGFRQGRGCVDMIFVARQLVEKAREHNCLLFTLFIDLKKAYDSVPRAALWQVLEKYGVPPTLLSVVRSFHEGMRASVRVKGHISDSFGVRNGVRQGCTIAPVLFNLYFCAVFEDWRQQCSLAGVSFRYSHGRKLVGDRTAKSHLQTSCVTESKFADDAALYASTRDNFEAVASSFVRVASGWGLTVSLIKSKGMVSGIGADTSVLAPITVEGGVIDLVEQFQYLGSIISSDGELYAELSGRLAKAAKMFGSLRQSIFVNKSLSVKTRQCVYRSTVVATLLYGSETWALKARQARRLEVFHNRCVRAVLGVSRHQQWRDHISSEQLAVQFGMCNGIGVFLVQHRLRWLGHVARMNDNRLPKQILFGELLTARPSHGPKQRWRDVVLRDIQGLGLDALNWYDAAQDRSRWRDLCLTISSGGVPRGPSVVTGSFSCGCGRTFGRSGDLTRHRNYCTGQPPPPRQMEFYCECGRVFHRKGDRTRHQRYCKC